MAETLSAPQIYSKINQLINSSRFNEAFLMLKSRMKNFPSLDRETNELIGVENTYKYLIDFLAGGNNDPARDEVIEQIRDSLNKANDSLLREFKLKDSSDLYSSTRRMIMLQKTSFLPLLESFKGAYFTDNPDGGSKVSETQASILNDIFNYVWTLSGTENSEFEIISSSLEDPELPEYLKLLIISALIIGSLSYFDANSYDILLSQYENSDSLAIKARAITGILLLSLLNSSRLKGNMNLRSRLLLSVDDKDLHKLVSEVLFGIILTYDTQRIDSKMRNEVLPGLMKMKPEFLDKMRNMASDSENFLSESNPDWEDIFENSEIGDKIREINDLQMEGADVMVTAFSHLKSFPFFSKVSSWFLPFLPGYYEYANLNLKMDDEYVKRFTTVMCESDLHSFLLSLKNLPEDQRRLMLTNIESQMKEAQEALTNAIGETESDILSKKIRQALQDLYRFFKFFRKKDDFTDPFGRPFLASHIRPLIETLSIEPKDIRLLGEFYFQKEYFDEASDMLELYDSIDTGDFSVWEKIGFSHDKMRRYDKAVEWYRKAELVNPNNQWLNKKLAIALKNSGNPKEALGFYQIALEKEPENYHLLMSLAQCLIDLGEYQQALQHLYHAQYLKPEKRSVQRALAWAELMGGNASKAKDLYVKLLAEEKADKTDYLNAAHCYLSMGDLKNAVPLYKKFIEKSENPEIRSLVIAIRDDSETLKRLKIKTEDLRLLVDKIRYDSEK